MPVMEPTTHTQLSMFASRVSSRTITQENAEDKYLLLVPLRRGNLKLECDGGTIHDGDVRPGMLRILAPGERVRITTRTAPQSAILSIPGPEFRAIASEQINRRKSASLSKFQPILRPRYQVERLCLSLSSAFEFDGNHRQLFVDGLTLALLSVVLNPQATSADTTSATSKGELSDAQLAQCLDYADSRIAEKLDLNAWAAVLGISATEFARRFQQKTQVAPYTWFMNWRIDRAKQLLSRNIPVVEVAFEVGFCSQSHFTEAFRRRVGMSPGRWRAHNFTMGFR